MDQPVIKLNVGGQIFMTRKSTLLNCPDSFLGKLVQTDMNNLEILDGCLFFDRNPEVFKYILEFYRTDVLTFPSSIPRKLIWKEIEFWSIPDQPILPDGLVWTNDYLTSAAKFVDWFEKSYRYRDNMAREHVFEFPSRMLQYTSFFKCNSNISFETEYRSVYPSLRKRGVYTFGFNQKSHLLPESTNNLSNIYSFTLQKMIRDEQVTVPKEDEDDFWNDLHPEVFEHVHETCDCIMAQHRLYDNPIILEEILKLFWKMGWDARITKNKIKCGEHYSCLLDVEKINPTNMSYCVECSTCELRRDNDPECPEIVERDILEVTFPKASY
jgi:hypothetical protein